MVVFVIVIVGEEPWAGRTVDGKNPGRGCDRDEHDREHEVGEDRAPWT